MSSKPLELPPKMQKLYGLLIGEGDVDIVHIYKAMFDRDPVPSEQSESRNAQKQLGPYITKLNRRLRNHGQAVKPGRIKATYCLTSI